MSIDAKELARKFCRLLEDDLADDALAEVVSRNAAEPNPSICHTHDFCDANQVMLDALVCCGHSGEYDLSDEALNTLINDAWAIAKAADFCVEDI